MLKSLLKCNKEIYVIGSLCKDKEYVIKLAVEDSWKTSSTTERNKKVSKKP